MVTVVLGICSSRINLSLIHICQQLHGKAGAFKVSLQFAPGGGLVHQGIGRSHGQAGGGQAPGVIENSLLYGIILAGKAGAGRITGKCGKIVNVFCKGQIVLRLVLLRLVRCV